MKLSESSHSIEALFIIIDRGKAERISDILGEHEVKMQFVCLGEGTAPPNLRSLLGLEQEKDVIISLIPGDKVSEIMSDIKTKTKYDKAGKGIMFTLSLTGFNALIYKLVLNEDIKLAQKVRREVDSMEETRKELIITVISRGNADIAMEAAKQAGATGGTMIRGRGMGINDVEQLLMIKIQPEKDILLIVSEADTKKAIMQAICNTVLERTGERAFSFSLPINELAGISSVGR